MPVGRVSARPVNDVAADGAPTSRVRVDARAMPVKANPRPHAMKRARRREARGGAEGGGSARLPAPRGTAPYEAIGSQLSSSPLRGFCAYASNPPLEHNRR